MKLWQGLGYYSRARNLQKAARVIMETYGGGFPTDYDAIRALPGVGDYTAGAISAIAFGLPRPAVDGNVLRVVSRIAGDRRDVTRPETKRAVTGSWAGSCPWTPPGTLTRPSWSWGPRCACPTAPPSATSARSVTSVWLGGRGQLWSSP